MLPPECGKELGAIESFPDVSRGRFEVAQDSRLNPSLNAKHLFTTMKISLCLAIFLFSSLQSAVFAADNARRPIPAFGIIYNDDADLAYVVPDRVRSEALLRENIAGLAETPVKTLVYCLGMGGDLMLYDTKVASQVGWRKAPDEKSDSFMAMRMENARVCIGQGADAVRTAGEEAKRIGLFFIPSLRMNDAHFMGHPEEHSMTSAFWFKHRNQYNIKDSPLPFQPAYGNLLDYSQAEVRRHRLDTAFEAIERNRDLIDGFELDFNRFQVFFPKGKAAEGAPKITEMVRQVRARLDQVARQQRRPLYLFVRIPPSLADSRFAGLEVETWIREGLVDVVSPAQIMTLAGDMPIRDLLELGRLHGVKVYPTLYPRTSWRLPFPETTSANRYQGAQISREATLDEIRAAAANYFAMQVDGFYLFNFYNAFGSTRPHSDSLYRVFRDLARPENLRGQPKVYVVTKSYYNDGPGSYAYGKQLPSRLARPTPLVLTLPIAEDPADSAFPLKQCELRLGLKGVVANTSMVVTLNGKEVLSGAVPLRNAWSTREILGTVPKQKDAAELYVHLPIGSQTMVRKGNNTITVALQDPSKEAVLTDCELRYAYHNDLDSLWRRKPTPFNASEPSP